MRSRIGALAWANLAGLRDRLINGRIFRAVILTFGAQFLSQVMRLGGSLIMTRLLAPEMFGLMSLVVMIQVTLSLLSDVGLRAAIIQSPRGDDTILLNTVWTIQAIRGVVVWIVCAIIAGALFIAARSGVLEPHAALASPELPYVLVASAVGSVITGFQSTKLMTAGRNLALFRVVVIEGAAQIGGLTVMIGLAVLTKSIWSLVTYIIVSSIITTTLSHVYLPGITNHFAWDRNARAEILKFGVWVLASSTAYVLSTNIDRALLGALISATALGVYSIALTLSAVVDGLVSRLYESVVLPALSESGRAGGERLRDQLMRWRLPFDLWYLGAAGLIFALGPSIVSLLYDARYADAGPMLQILSFSLVFTRLFVFNMAYLASGRPHYQAILNATKLVAVVILIPVLFEAYGLHGAIWAIALHPVATLPLYYWFNRELGLNDLTHEVIVLPAWPAGYLLGVAVIEVLTLVTG